VGVPIAGAVLGRSLYTGAIRPAEALRSPPDAESAGHSLPGRQGRPGGEGRQFVALRDAGDPVEQARAYDAAGADELMFLDITASHENRGTILDVVARTADVCFMPLSVGGGIREVDDMRRLLLAGADKVSINTAAVENPDLIAAGADAFGAQCVVVAIDAKQREDGSWGSSPMAAARTPASTSSTTPPRRSKRGAGEILLTSMDRDGAKSGYDIALLKAVTGAVSVPVIASGGAGTTQHLVEAARDGGADAVLAASIFHFGEISVGEAKAAMAAAGIPVRMADRRGSPHEPLLPRSSSASPRPSKPARAAIRRRPTPPSCWPIRPRPPRSSARKPSRR
jgi:cyclase